ncbi:hypothetical protein F5050DRAFT_1709457 [Lentinula boryana]|uniref:Lipoprotein n=1 Tax=Lentinula boryana TaxID=40481 RepID=A0ABQ8QMN8_9AGAR|nr:hypothetical protein F5050DRAFT_1709457 [Lentinula boryana]
MALKTILVLGYLILMSCAQEPSSFDLELGSLISDVGITGKVKQVINFQGIPLLVYAEVKALKQIGEFHAAGIHYVSVVILMEKKPGEMIEDTVQWKQDLSSEAKDKYCEKVAKIATSFPSNSKIYLYDTYNYQLQIMLIDKPGDPPVNDFNGAHSIGRVIKLDQEVSIVIITANKSKRWNAFGKLKYYDKRRANETNWWYTFFSTLIT